MSTPKDTPRTDAEIDTPHSICLTNDCIERLPQERREMLGLPMELTEYVVPADFARKLERELAATQILLADSEIDRLAQRAELTQLAARVKELEEDAAILDWLENPAKVYCVKVQRQPDGEYILCDHPKNRKARDAIRSAMKQEESA